MTRINTLSLLAISRDPPPSSVWAMTMAVLGAAFVAAASQRTGKGVQMTPTGPVR